MIKTGDAKDTLKASSSGYMSKKTAREIERMKDEAKRQRAKKAAASASSVQVRGKMPNGVFSEPRKIRTDVHDSLTTTIKNVLPDYASFTNALQAKEAHLFLGIDNSVPATPEVIANEDLLADAFAACEANVVTGIRAVESKKTTSTAKVETCTTTPAKESQRTSQARNSLPVSAAVPRLKPPSLVMPLKELSSSENQRVSQSQVENILKEMTQDIGPPLTDIETPVKGKGFAFPKPMPVSGLLINGAPKLEDDASLTDDDTDHAASALHVESPPHLSPEVPMHNHRQRGLSISSSSSSDGSDSDSDTNSDSSGSDADLAESTPTSAPASQCSAAGLLNSTRAPMPELRPDRQMTMLEVKTENPVAPPPQEAEVDDFHSILETHPELPQHAQDIDRLSLVEKPIHTSTNESGLHTEAPPNVYLMSSSVIGSNGVSNGQGFSLMPNPSMYVEYSLEKPISPLPSDRLFDSSPDHHTLTSPFATAIDCDLFGGADELTNLHTLDDSHVVCSEDGQLKLPGDFSNGPAMPTAFIDRSEAMEISDNEQDGDVKPNIFCSEPCSTVVATPSLPSSAGTALSHEPRLHPSVEAESFTVPRSKSRRDGDSQNNNLPPIDVNRLKVKIPLSQVNLQNFSDICNVIGKPTTAKQTLQYHSNGPGRPALANGLATTEELRLKASNPIWTSHGSVDLLRPDIANADQTDATFQPNVYLLPQQSEPSIANIFQQMNASKPESLTVKIQLSLLSRIPQKQLTDVDLHEPGPLSAGVRKRKLPAVSVPVLPMPRKEELAKPCSDLIDTDALKSPKDKTKRDVKLENKDAPLRKRQKKLSKESEVVTTPGSNICTSCGTLRLDSGNERSRMEAYRTSYEKHLTQGRKLKHTADSYTDFKERGHKYVEAVLAYLQFLVGLEASKKTESKAGLEQFMKVNSQCITLVDHVSNHYARKKTKTHPVVDRRFLYLCLRMQSMLYFKLFNIRKDATTKASKLLSEYYKAFKPRDASGPSPYSATNRSLSASPPFSPNPSPGGSVASYGSSGSSGSAEKGGPSVQSMMSIPVDMYQKAQQYLTQTKFLLHGNRLWDEGSVVGESCEDFAKELALGVGALTMQSSLLHVIDYSSAGLMLIQRNPNV